VESRNQLRPLAPNDRPDSKHPRYAYAKTGSAVHFKRRPSIAQRLQAVRMQLELRGTKDVDARREVLRKHKDLPVHFVVVKTAILLDHSRYTGEKLRAIRATGGAREKARRLRQAAREGVSYGLGA
jgi:hypothetical protein